MKRLVLIKFDTNAKIFFYQHLLKVQSVNEWAALLLGISLLKATVITLRHASVFLQTFFHFLYKTPARDLCIPSAADSLILEEMKAFADPLLLYLTPASLFIWSHQVPLSLSLSLPTSRQNPLTKGEMRDVSRRFKPLYFSCLIALNLIHTSA